ncbi:endo alpha-1,4 polygalactosaminidase [Cupriavidus pauculus]|uniref:Endo alpha-1,4 polygalactosaminidase n=1 Tax=Cupriavidus pauculus TaxID=82633 RepID=A0A5P2H650_9BURK|nr:endo alpha-1,4 polygalactosaminidase [Cupriavidus pauculus]QET03502.1 endo alpha-1,4 polygalactosaminidase [Cupriavidus pauculus]
MFGKFTSQAFVCLLTACASGALTACGGGGDDSGGSTVRVSDSSGTNTTSGTTSGTASGGSNGSGNTGTGNTGSGNAGSGNTGNTNAGTQPTTSRWVPQLGDTWQLQLQGTANIGYNAAVYDIDMYDTPQATINLLKSQGKRVVCYFSAGSSENWRADFGQFQASDMGNGLSGWPGERWLDTRSANVRAIMAARMDMAKAKGCDGIDTDNVDGYTNNTGLPLTAATQLDYNRYLAAQAHARGLAIGLKNDVDQVAQLASDFDFAVNEQCFQYNECGVYSAFTTQGKPVFQVEYDTKYKVDATRAPLCASARALNLRTLVLPLSLNDGYRYSCD